MTTLLRALEKRTEDLACHDASCAPPPVGTGGSKPSGGGSGGVSGHSDGYGVTIDKVNPDNRVGRAEHVKALMDVEYDPEWDVGAGKLAQGFQDGTYSVRIRVHNSLAEQILITDGKYKTQHESGSSQGMFDPDVRDDYETQMFGADLPRPIYGYVAGGPSSGWLHYGDVAIVMKPEVHDRSTLTVGDSLDMEYGGVAPVKISDLRDGKVDGERLSHSTNSITMSMPDRLADDDWERLGYVEAQIFGGVSKSDIAKIVVPQSTIDRDGMDVQRLRDAGYEIEILDDREGHIEFGLLAAYQRREEELACYDASCAPPPVGTGGSKKGPSKGSLSPSASGRVAPDMMNANWKGTVKAFGGEKAFGKMFEADLSDIKIDGESVTVKIDRISDYGEDFYVQGTFMAGERKMGSFSRNVGTSDDGTHLVADHARLSLREDARGLGIAQRFNDHAMKGYEELGVDRIVLEAALTHGPYAWARQGYRIDESRTTRHDWVQDQTHDLRTMVKEQLDSGAVTQPQADEMLQTITDLRNASAKGADVQPIHLASIGEGDPVWTDQNGDWIGKRQLIGDDVWDRKHRTWNGVYYLGRRSELASASERRLEELACHDASCAPPPIGTGGSKPSGASGGPQRGSSGSNSVGTLKFKGTSSLQIAEGKRASGEAMDAYMTARAETERRRAVYGVESPKYKHAAKMEGLAREKLQKASIQKEKNLVVSTEITTKGGRKIKVYQDTEFEWSNEITTAIVNRYADLVDNFGIENPIPITMGPRASAQGYEDTTGIKDGFRKWYPHAWAHSKDERSQAAVVSHKITKKPHIMMVETNMAGTNNRLKNMAENKSGMFNDKIKGMSDVEMAEYITTHEFGHQVYFNKVTKYKPTAKDAENGLGREEGLMNKHGMLDEFEMGNDMGDLRHPSLGSYAYSSLREFAAETFAVDYYGWDDGAGIPLDSMLKWVYDD